VKLKMEILISKFKKWLGLDNLVLCAYSGTCIYAVIGLIIGFSSWWNLILSVSILIVTALYKRANKKANEEARYWSEEFKKIKEECDDLRKHTDILVNDPEIAELVQKKIEGLSNSGGCVI
jgi:type III secretory pathway component EscV